MSPCYICNATMFIESFCIMRKL